jgi:hypothetical protein
MTSHLIAALASGEWIFGAGAPTLSGSMEIVLASLATAATGAFTLYTFAVSVISGFRSTMKGMEVRNRLRPGRNAWQAITGSFSEPLLPLSKDALHLTETGDMMDYTMKSWRYGFAFIGSGLAFLVTAFLLFIAVYPL